MTRYLTPIFGLLCGICLSSLSFAQDFAPNGLRIYPSNPTTGDQVYIIVNYPCPYPSRAPLKIQRINNQVLVELATLGNVCLSDPDNDLNREYAYSIGSFGNGTFDLAVGHRVTLDDITFTDYFIGPPLRTRFTVTEGTSELISGAWVSDKAPGQVLNVYKTGAKDAYINWASYDGTGAQAWFAGQLMLDKGILAGALVRSSGPVFGESNPSSVSQNDWGSIEVQHVGCNQLRVRYSSALPGFGSGTLDFRPAVRPAGLRGCEPTDLRGANLFGE